ncbi:MAG: ABC transporter substrate-binding protein, partial [Acidimicrobiia bacterium]|nr:ABC transporter substrate-binding protein [Acidimicrobiia bacterium]
MRRLLLLMAIVIAAAACSDSAQTAETVSRPPPTEVSPPTTAPPSDAGFPVIVVDPTGSMTIMTQPRRIVSMSATHTEILYAIGAGDQIAATDLTSNYPPEANDTPKVDSFAFNLEEVLALQPDLVVVAFDFSGEVEALDAAGVNVLLMPPPSDVAQMLLQFDILGTATGNVVGARAERDRLKTAIDGLVDVYNVTDAPLTIFHEVDETLFSVNSSTFLGDIYGSFGLVNIADEAPDEFGSGFPQLSAEFILEADPDLI